jgi:hypothetical protein
MALEQKFATMVRLAKFIEFFGYLVGIGGLILGIVFAVSGPSFMGYVPSGMKDSMVVGGIVFAIQALIYGTLIIAIAQMVLCFAAIEENTRKAAIAAERASGAPPAA